MSGCQQTLARPVSAQGVGLHTGLPASVKIHPAAAGTGIVFVRTDQDPKLEIRAVIENVDVQQGQGRQTTLRSGEVKIRTIEHLMAALFGAGIDNARVEIEGEELPGLDGSAAEYLELLKGAGLAAQDLPRQVWVVDKPAFVQGPNYSMTVLPSDRFAVSYTLSYDHDSLHDQFVYFEVSPDTFESQIAAARTFCLKHEAEALLSQGYGRGASFQNTLVFDGGVPIGNTLRFKDEAARHKVLDLIGDLFLIGRRLQGHVITHRTGHRQNYELVRKIMETAPASPKKGDPAVMSASTKGELNIQDIKKIIPHRYPFLLVDRVTKLEPGKRAVGIKNVTMNDIFFQGHFPEHPIMPGVLIIEAMAQVGGVVMLCMHENHGKIAYLMSIDHAKFRQPVFPGDTLRLEVEVVRSRSKTGQCTGKAYVGDKLVCEAEVKFAVVDKDESAGPA
ncbi:MAG: UDP-3-O-[3-hydroxymyristoyl] N-acetylglucosamine deacetylase [Candidatus Omnitrophica bacterium]|nr:UDP-3-O-[3-hydroxymyristoyl] N-acetylglucosamine deacetylase [Candidatus Omnitrophota bacterium]